MIYCASITIHNQWSKKRMFFSLNFDNFFFLDSSPKASATKHAHLMSKETIQDTVNMLSTPTRRTRTRFMLGNTHANMMNDDSPILSQESINISWKWNQESTPIRPTKMRRSIITNNSAHREHLHQLTNKQSNCDNQNATETVTSETMSPKLVDRETHSPKGLYKFQEEMRKIQFDTESNASCDNRNDTVNDDKSVTAADTGYPERPAQADVNSNARYGSDNFNVEMMETNETDAVAVSHNPKHGIDDALTDDLFNDSDFDQILLTCKIPAQNVASETNFNQTSVKKASSAPEIKASDSSNSSGSNWNLIDDDCFDDLVKDFDVDIPSDSLNTSTKFSRHKSMPQQPQNPSTSNTKMMQQQATHVQQNSYMNRKSFTRHESMPITNSSINRSYIANNRSMSGRQNSGMHIYSKQMFIELYFSVVL